MSVDIMEADSDRDYYMAVLIECVKNSMRDIFRIIPVKRNMTFFNF